MAEQQSSDYRNVYASKAYNRAGEWRRIREINATTERAPVGFDVAQATADVRLAYDTVDDLTAELAVVEFEQRERMVVALQQIAETLRALVLEIGQGGRSDPEPFDDYPGEQPDPEPLEELTTLADVNPEAARSEEAPATPYDF